MSTTYYQSKIFDQPFAYIVVNYQISKFCSYCLRKPEGDRKLQLCGACQHCRYCDKGCQRLHWLVHKTECGRLKKSFPKLPITESMFLARLVDRVRFIEEKGDVHNWQKDRRWDELMTHEKEIKADKVKMDHFEMVYKKTKDFMQEAMPEKDDFFLVFCKTWINSHSVHNSSGNEVGMALDLGVSMYNHCCRPNCALIFDGFRATLRPISRNVDAANPKTAYISYTDVGRSKYQRRKDLWMKWYFYCECQRCMDPEDDRLTSIKCVNPKCEEAIVITEESKPTRITCPECKSITEPERIMEAQAFMKDLPQQFTATVQEDPEERKKIQAYFEQAEILLHNENIYYCRLLTICAQIAGGDRNTLAVSENMHKLVYQNYRRCLPEADRHIGFQCMHLVKSMIEQGRRDEAIPYAYEAMTIFEVVFGLDHPYYLQTLALWTFLNERTEKTDDQLFSLMHFEYNRPIDLSRYLDCGKPDASNAIKPDATNTIKPDASDAIKADASNAIKPEVSKDSKLESCNGIMPDDSNAVKPDSSNASKPNPSNASKPDASKASKPDASKASKPDASNASKPDASKASKPDASNASKPDASNASKPDASSAIKSDPSNASKPDASKASKPDASKASKPDASKASKPDASNASKPDASSAIKSDPSNASKPDASNASKPDDSKAIKPEPSNASKPDATKGGKKADASKGGKKPDASKGAKPDANNVTTKKSKKSTAPVKVK